MRLNKFGLLLIIFLVPLLLTLNGCNEQLTRAERNTCFEMASKTYAQVPECFDEKQCYSLVEKLFKTDLDYTGETTLYEVKSQVSRSWVQFNLARKEAKKLQDACQNGNASNIPPLVNQTRFYLEASMREMDTAMKKSFDFISGEEKLLTEEKIDLVKEEKVFENLVEIRKIVSELKNGATNSESYVSYYLKRAEAFNSAGQLKGFENILEKETFILAKYDYFEGIVSKTPIAENGSFPSISKTLRNAVLFIENEVYSKQSLSALYRFPMGEFMQLYSSAGGESDSALKRFAELANRLSENTKALKENNQSTWKIIEEEERKTKSLLEENKSFSKYSELGARILNKQAIGKKELNEQANQLEKTLLEIRIKKSELKISLGEEIKAVKDLVNEYKTLNQELSYQKTELMEAMQKACDEKCEEIKKKTEINDEALEIIQNNAIFFAVKALKETGEQKLEYCEKAINLNDELNEGLKDYEKLEAKKIDSTKQCFDFLEQIFKQVELIELQRMFEQLKTKKVTSENLLGFEEECENIKNQVENEIESDETIKKIKENIEELNKLIEELGKIGEEKEKENYEAKKEELEKLLEDKKYEEIYPIKKEIEEKLEKWKKDAEEILKNKIIDYAKKYYKIIILSNEVPTINKEFSSVKRLLLNNPFKSIQENFYIEVNTKDFVLKEKSNCVDSINYFGENTRIYFNCLEEGINFVDFNSSGIVYAKEVEELIFATNKESLLKKKMILEGKEEYPKLIIETKKPLIGTITSTIVLVDGEEIISFEKDNKTTFIAERVSNNSSISIFYKITGLITINSELKETQELGEGTLLKYLVSTKNNYPKSVEGTLILPISVNSFSEKVNVIDEQKKSLKTNLVGGEIVLEKQQFIGLEEKNFEVELIVTDYAEHYYSVLQKLCEDLEKEGETEISEKIREFLKKIITKESIKEAEELITQGKKKLTELQKGKENEALIKMARENLLKKIEQMEKDLDRLVNAGMEKEALELREIIDKAKKLLEGGTLDDYAKAEDLISKKIFSVSEIILEKIKKIKAELLKKTERTESEKALLEEIEEFEETIAYEPWNASTNYEKILLMEKEIAEQIGKLVPGSQKIVELIEKCSKKINLLESNLNFGEEELIKAKFIQPITQSRLKKIKLAITDYNFGVIDEKKVITELEGFDKELEEALDSIRLQAVRVYNKAIDLKVDEELLAKSKELIDQNKYTNAIIVLTNVVSQTGFFGFELPLVTGIVPIILIIGIAFVVKQNYAKKRVKESGEKEKIMKEWKE